MIPATQRKAGKVAAIALCAATSDEDAARVRKCLSECTYIEIDSGHDIHIERPDEYVDAVARLPLPSIDAP